MLSIVRISKGMQAPRSYIGEKSHEALLQTHIVYVRRGNAELDLLNPRIIRGIRQVTK